MEKEHLQDRNPSEVPGGPSRTPPAEPDARVEDWLDRACAPLVGLAPYRVRLALREEYRARLEALLAAQREAGHSEDEAIVRALKQAGKPTRMSRRHVTEWQVARGSVWPAMRTALWCFGVPWSLLLGQCCLPWTCDLVSYLLLGMGCTHTGLRWAAGRYFLTLFAGLPLLLGGLTGVLGRRRQGLGAFFVSGCVAIAATLVHFPWGRGSSSGIGLLGAVAPMGLVVVFGTLGAVLGSAVHGRGRAAPSQAPTEDAAPPHEKQIEEYLDGVCGRLVGVASYAARREIRAELASHLDSLVAAYRELGCTPDEATARALQRCGHPAQLAHAWAEEWARAGVATQPRHALLASLAVFSLALLIWRYATPWPPFAPGHATPWFHARMEVMLGLRNVLPAAAGYLVWRIAPGKACQAVAGAIIAMCGSLEAAGWLTGHLGTFRGFAHMLILSWLPIGMLTAALPTWLRRLRWWLATKVRPLSA